jgi:hypothetical protein
MSVEGSNHNTQDSGEVMKNFIAALAASLALVAGTFAVAAPASAGGGREDGAKHARHTQRDDGPNHVRHPRARHR